MARIRSEKESVWRERKRWNSDATMLALEQAPPHVHSHPAEAEQADLHNSSLRIYG
jgi:hypothetical protein